MALTRTTVTDDTGGGTDGTIANASWWTTQQDMIDGRWSEYTITSTGSQTDLSITDSGVECDVLRCNNASSLTIRSIAKPASPVKAGKKLVIVSVGAGAVYLSHQYTTGTTAANRLINFATAMDTPLAAGSGVAVYEYDETTDRWRMIAHEQGDVISYATTLAANSGSFTSATATMNYLLRGREVAIEAYITITTIGTAAGYFTLTLPVASKAGMYFSGCGINVSLPGNGQLMTYVAPSSSSLLIFKYDGTVPTTTNHTLAMNVRYTIS